MRRTRGFSLIELLIVVAIILIIAAIAIPNYLNARLQANESAAIGALRTLNTAQISYNSAYPSVGFSSTLSALGPGSSNTCTANSSTACLIDSVLAAGQKSGYTFTVTGVSGTPAASYQFIATPLQPGWTGTRYFCSFADAVVRYSMSTLTSCDNTVTPR